MRKLIPTQEFYDIFRLYRLDRKCPSCKQIIKSKRPSVKFYLIKELNGNMIRVKQSNLKHPRSFHRNYFHY